jgi:ribokinase
MTNRTDMRSPDAIVLTHALEKLRACDGLTSSRLENSRNIECGPLLGLAAVRRYAAVHDIELSQAALDVIRECVRDNLQGSQRIVADAVLGLAVFSEAYTIHGIQAESFLRCAATYLLVSQSRQGRVEPVEFRASCWFGGR